MLKFLILILYRWFEYCIVVYIIIVYFSFFLNPNRILYELYSLTSIEGVQICEAKLKVNIKTY